MPAKTKIIRRLIDRLANDSAVLEEAPVGASELKALDAENRLIYLCLNARDIARKIIRACTKKEDEDHVDADC